MLSTYWGQSKVLSPVLPSEMSKCSRNSNGGCAVDVWTILEHAAASAELRQMFVSNFLPAACGPPLELVSQELVVIAPCCPLRDWFSPLTSSSPCWLLDHILSQCPIHLTVAWFCCSPILLLPSPPFGYLFLKPSPPPPPPAGHAKGSHYYPKYLDSQSFFLNLLFPSNLVSNACWLVGAGEEEWKIRFFPFNLCFVVAGLTFNQVPGCWLLAGGFYRMVPCKYI